MGTVARTRRAHTVAVVITRWKRGNENHRATSWNNHNRPAGKVASVAWTAQACVPAQHAPVTPSRLPPPPPPLTSDSGVFPAQLQEDDAGPGSRLPFPTCKVPPSHRSPAQPCHPSLPLALTAACPLTSPWCQHLLSLADNCSHPHLGLLSAPGWGQVT